MTIVKFERRICDRCGAATEMKTGPNSWLTINFAERGCGQRNIADIPPTADLCGDCCSSFVQWWRKKHDQRGLVSLEMMNVGKEGFSEAAIESWLHRLVAAGKVRQEGDRFFAVPAPPKTGVVREQ